MPTLTTALRKGVTDALAARLALLADFNGETDRTRTVEVRRAYKFNASNPSREQVYTGRCTSDTPSAGNKSGAHIRNEKGILELTVLVIHHGLDADEADDRLDEIGAEVEDWVDTHKNGVHSGVPVPGLLTLIVVSQLSDYVPVGTGVGSARTYRIQWTGRLREATS